MSLWNIFNPSGKETALTTRKVQEPFLDLQARVNDLFEDFLTPLSLRWTPRWSERFPRVYLTETPDELQVHAELPGVDEKNVEITLSEGVLTLKGQKQSERKEGEGGELHTERLFGSFCRSIPLAYEIEDDQVEATYEKGVLRIRLPKSKKAQERVRSIPITKE